MIIRQYPLKVAGELSENKDKSTRSGRCALALVFSQMQIVILLACNEMQREDRIRRRSSESMALIYDTSCDCSW